MTNALPALPLVSMVKLLLALGKDDSWRPAMKAVLDTTRMAARDRKRCVAAWRRRFFTEAIFHGQVRDLDLTWDGGHVLPGAFAGLHVVEFHARGRIVRESVDESAVTDFWRTDAECVGAIRRAVEALNSLIDCDTIGIETRRI